MAKKPSKFRLGICITAWNSVIFKIWSEYTTAGDADFILYLDAKLPDSFYADFFIVQFTAINGKQQVGDQASEYLDH